MEIYYEPALGLLIGFIIIFIVRGRGERKKKILSNYKETTAIIVAQRSNYSGGSRIFYPVVQFEAVPGLVIRQEYSEGRDPIKYATGKEVIVQYWADDPKEFLIKGDNTKLTDLIFILVGIGFILYSSLLFFKIFFPSTPTDLLLLF